MTVAYDRIETAARGHGRTVQGCTTRAVRQYITNLPVDTGAEPVHSHWGIENSLHQLWDDIFQEGR